VTKETIKTASAPSPTGPYSQGIVGEGFVFVSGQVGIDPKTGGLPDGIQAQTRQALTNVASILESAGTSLERAVKVGVYLRDISDFDEMNKVYRTFFTKDPPARTTVQAVLVGQFLVEIDCITQARPR
jgi:2-iminobutanoate/2-iminopropanoate deaminase